MKSTFDSIDTDNSGFIDINELTNVSRALGHELKEEELTAVFADLDENSDSKISYEEFVKWWKNGRRGKGQLMRKIVGMQAKTKHFIDSAHEEIK
jgi:Ca2+-binding EF-hand superfamily protein